MATDPFDSIHSYVDGYTGMGVSDGIGYTLAPPATRQTARFGIRRPRHNTYASIIHSQAPILPTDPTRPARPRTECRRGAGCTSAANDILESKELLCGDCIQPVRGPGQAAWVSAYDKRDELQQLLIDSEARDALIARAYKDVAAQSFQTESKPVLCKALARLYQHDSHRPLRANPNWSDEDWAVARWYSKNCYPYVSPAGSVMFYERPLPPKSWIDNVVRTLGPIYDYQSSCCMKQVGGGCASCPSGGGCGPQACPCSGGSEERDTYPRLPPPTAPLNGFEPQPNCCSVTKDCSGTKPTNNQLARAERQQILREQREAQALNQSETLQHYTGNLPPGRLCQSVPTSTAESGGVYRRNPSMRKFYGLFGSDTKKAEEIQREQARIVAEQRARLDAANPDYGERIYQAQVRDHISKSGTNQVRTTQSLDPNVGAYS